MIAALYEDDEILVIDKPAGLASQPGEGVRVSVVEAVERDFGFRPYLVHRLDKETAGCLVVARSSAAASRWTRLVESRELRKTYRAVVSGEPPGSAGRFDESVRGREGEKAALTEWRLIASFGRSPSDSRSESRRFSYLELVLGTGRTHQIRVHLAAHDLPILGDDRHGDFALNKRLKAELGLKRLLLVAWSLELPGGRKVRASVPDYLSAFLASFADSPGADAPRAEATGGRPVR
jgi:23S rRNA pseudouridine955/2504/2580 synthase